MPTGHLRGPHSRLARIKRGSGRCFGARSRAGCPRLAHFMPRTGEDLLNPAREATVHPDRALGFIYAAPFTPLTTTTPK
jgi:hypothetical protein